MSAQRDMGPWRNPQYSKRNPLAEGYRPGDVVHRSGIWYQSNVDNNLSMPGVNSDWTAFAPGRELNYVARTTNLSVTGALVDVTELTFTTVVGVRPIVLEAYVTSTTSDSTQTPRLWVMEGATQLTVADGNKSAANGDRTGAILAKVRLAPSAGNHTYKVQAGPQSGAGTCLFVAAATLPMFFQAIEV